MSDGFEFVFTEDHEEQVRDEHGDQVLDALQSRIERKQKEVRWKDSVPSLRQRLHKLIYKNRYAEMAFQAGGTDYRAVFVILENEDALVFYGAVEKNDIGSYNHSDQHKMLDTLQKNYHDVRSHAEEVLAEVEGDAEV